MRSLLLLLAAVAAAASFEQPAEPGSGVVNGSAQLILYGESACPDTSAFVVGPLNETIEKLGSLIDIAYVPFGNAYYLTERCGGEPAPDPCYNSTGCLYSASVRECFDEHCGSGSDDVSGCYANASDGSPLPVRCQHGAVECYANRIQACAVVSVPESSWPISSCLFYNFFIGTLIIGDSTPAEIDAVAKHCADVDGKGANESDWDAIVRCVNGTEGDSAVREMARRTPVHPGVPYLTLADGTAIDPTSEAIEAAVCALLPFDDPGRDIACKAAAQPSPPPPGDGDDGIDAGGISGIVLSSLVLAGVGGAGFTLYRRRFARRMRDPLLGIGSNEYGYLAAPVASFDTD